jgi:hypothetical protein
MTSLIICTHHQILRLHSVAQISGNRLEMCTNIRCKFLYYLQNLEKLYLREIGVTDLESTRAATSCQCQQVSS